MGGIGRAIGGIVKKFAPVVLGAIGGPVGMAIGGALQGLMNGGGLKGAITGALSSFIPGAGQMLSGGGNGLLSTVLGAVTGQGQGTGGIADIIKQVADQVLRGQTDRRIEERARDNLAQQAAYAQANQMRYQTV